MVDEIITVPGPKSFQPRNFAAQQMIDDRYMQKRPLTSTMEKRSSQNSKTCLTR